MRWQKEKDPLSPGKGAPRDGGLLFPFVGGVALALFLCSYFLWDESGGSGELSRAVSHFESFFEKNEAIAVLLGWVGGGR